MSVAYDLIIIGGGINGSALARLAARSGFRVALFERNDFGSGVTSRSTRLIHGGLRYLESGRFGLVGESLRDRRALLEAFPQQVKPQPFLIPVYRSDSRPPWYIQIGLWLYSVLARDPELSQRRRISAHEASALEPGLDPTNLRAVFLYYDCQAVYPERLALEMALQAEEAGALVRNHAPVTGLLSDGKRVAGVRVRSAGGEEEIEGRLVVNAGGPWVDCVRQLLPGSRSKPLLTLVNGAHIVVRSFNGAPRHAIYHEARSDRRPFFVIPWRDLYMIGTTETPYEGHPDEVAPASQEITYLLDEANSLFPYAGLKRESILFVWVGSRPLLRAEDSNLNRASREHMVYDHEQEEGLQGMLTMLGGKLTTAPSFASQVLEQAAKKLGTKPHSPPKTNQTLESQALTVDERLLSIYGRRATGIQDLATENSGWGAPVVPEAQTTQAEIIHSVRREKALTLGDIFLRRTGLGFHPDYKPAWARAVAEVAAPWLQWDEPAIQQAVQEYESERERTLFRVPQD